MPTPPNSGGFTGKTKRPAYQGLARIESRLKQIGLYVQYEQLASMTGGPSTEVKVGGRGILAGVGIVF
jgi:hypothetical protein